MPIDVILTDRIQNAIEEVFALEITPEGLENQLQKWRRSDKTSVKGVSNENVEDVLTRSDASIPFKTVEKVFETLNKAGRVIYLNELMEGSGLYFEPVQVPKKSPELIARLEKLQAKQDQLRYRAMVKNVDKELLYKEKKSMASEVRSTSRQLSTVVNFVLSVGGTFVFGFMCSQFAFTYIGMRIMFGIILASIVALAELYFMAKSSQI